MGQGRGTRVRGAAGMDRRAGYFGVPAISTGDIFRSNVEAKCALGVEARRYLDANDFVPHSVTNVMIRCRLQKVDALEGLVLDGYPPTASQVDYLDSVLDYADSRPAAETGVQFHCVEPRRVVIAPLCLRCAVRVTDAVPMVVTPSGGADADLAHLSHTADPPMVPTITTSSENSINCGSGHRPARSVGRRGRGYGRKTLPGGA